MQFLTLFAAAGVALSAILGVSAEEAAEQTTLWVPTNTVVETNTFTATRVEQIWTTVSPYEWETTFPFTFTQVKTVTEYAPVVTSPPERRHPREFDM